MSGINKGKIKLTIAKLVELSINTDKEATLAIIKTKGVATIRADQDGKVTITGSGKTVKFIGDRHSPKWESKSSV